MSPEGRDNSLDETLGPQKLYLRTVFSVLSMQYHCLSLAGMNLGRTRIGAINELALETIRAVTMDENFLYEDDSGARNTTEIWETFLAMERESEEGKLTPPPDIVLTTEQGNLLTKLAVMLSFGWDFANEDNGQGTLADHPIGFGAKVSRDLVIKMVDEGEVEKIYQELKGDKNKSKRFYNKLNRFYEELRLEVKFINFPPDVQYLTSEV